MVDQLALPFAAPDVANTTGPHATSDDQTIGTPSVGDPPPRKPTALALRSIPSPSERPAALRDCLAHVVDQGEIPASQTAAMRCAIARLEKITRTGTTTWPAAAAADLPADPERLQAILNCVRPAAHGLSPKRWSNIRSAITSMLLASGWVPAESRHGVPLTGAWGELIMLAHRDDAGNPLAPFGRYCRSRDLELVDVTTAVLAEYEDWRRQRTLTGTPRCAALSVQRFWNRLAATNPDLPLATLALESRVIWKAARLENLPQSFAADLEAYLNQMRNPDRLNPRHARRASETTVQHARRGMLRAATYLIESGVPRADLVKLEVLVRPAAYRTILERMDADCGQGDDDDTWAAVAVNISVALINMARRWAELDANDLANVEALHRMVKTSRGGLSRRIRDRLAQFAADEERIALFELPDRGFAQADKLLNASKKRNTPNNKGFTAAKLHETALAFKILLIQPLRRMDLARIDLAEHLVRDRRGRINRLVIRTHKKRREIDVSIPPDLAARIERHVAVFRPLLAGAATTSALFPGEHGGARCPDTLARQITKLVKRQLGALFSPHLARHLAAEMLLDDDPNNLVTVQRLLGHGTLSRTQDMYGITRTSAAQKSYVNLVERLRGGTSTPKRSGGRSK